MGVCCVTDDKVPRREALRQRVCCVLIAAAPSVFLGGKGAEEAGRWVWL